MKALELIALFVGYILIWAATNVKRGAESRIIIFSKHWWLQVVLIFIGSWLISFYYK